MIQIILYTRHECPLCDEARATLERELGERPFTLEEVDIDQDRELHARFRYEIPVVRIDGKLRFRGRVEPVLLRRLLRARDRRRSL